MHTPPVSQLFFHSTPFSRWSLRYLVLAGKNVGCLVHFPGAIGDRQPAQSIRVSRCVVFVCAEVRVVCLLIVHVWM